MILVIGASGFIGNYLIDDLINNGYEVFATCRNDAALQYFKTKKIKCCYLDISDKHSFDKLPSKQIEAVILLAALLPANVSNYDPYKYIDINITGTLNVLEFCRIHGIKKIIYTTSYFDVYNHWEKGNPIKDDILRSYPLIGDHAMYIISKNAATDFVLHYNEEYDFQGIVFRLPPVYGYGPHSEIYVDGKFYKSGFQIFLEKAISGENIEIFGDKTISRDIVYVKDVTQAFIKAIKSNSARGIYNISSGIAETLEQQVQDIVEIFGKEGKKSTITHSPDKKNNAKSFILDISKAKNDFNYEPQFIPFKKLLMDYKKEMNDKKYKEINISRIKKQQ